MAEMLADGIFGSLLASDHIPLSSLLRLIEETKEQINNKSR
ncbi:hypothetical protein [Telmatospirillum sp.]|nr:hypothetical protein [Telmatospirillum sp.]MDR3438170.1 hypothetical protein [Telmatospirillum sp.]